MCGIVGFVGPGEKRALRQMVSRLVHRGPDGEGIYEDPERQVLLGHTRLAIIDLDHGAQPMWDASGETGVIYNGEIYNHRILRKELEEKGHRFLTDHSDTEVLVHGYREWGKSLLPRLNGMFAFCLFDRPGNRLILARDRMGEKPLYYTEQGGLFAFASEPNALFAHPNVKRELDGEGVQKFFAYGFSPSASSVFRNVKKLLPGEVLNVDLSDRRVSSEHYFKFQISPDESLSIRSDDDLAEELRSLLDAAVSRRLEADVPLGLFLSGGIDSSIILESACRQSPANTVDAFTIGFQEESFDERNFARIAAKHTGCRHHLQEATIEHAKELIAPIFSHLGEPFGDPSILPTSMLCSFARESVTVALSGDGGDELFAGYDPFLALGPARVYEKCIPRPMHKLARWLSGRLPFSDRNMSLEFKLRRALMGLSYKRELRLPAWMSAIEPEEMASFFQKPLSADELYSEALEVWNNNNTGSDIDRALEYFTRIYLPEDILFKSDRASMMHSLEARAVFLDNQIVSFASRLPHRYKLRNGKRKWLLKKALSEQLPAELINRPKKGFGVPLAKWLRDLPPPECHTDDVMKNGEVLARWKSHNAGETDERLMLFSWLGLQQI